MSRFTGPLSIRFQDDGRLAMLLEDLVWHCEYLGSGNVVTVPHGFVTDGATVPQPLWWFMPPWGDVATRAAILHDYLLEQHDNRYIADRQFYLALKALGTGKVRAKLLYWAVRVFGMVRKSIGFEVKKT